jgi:chromosome segregation ATPase
MSDEKATAEELLVELLALRAERDDLRTLLKKMEHDTRACDEKIATLRAERDRLYAALHGERRPSRRGDQGCGPIRSRVPGGPGRTVDR